MGLKETYDSRMREFLMFRVDRRSQAPRTYPGIDPSHLTEHVGLLHTPDHKAVLGRGERGPSAGSARIDGTVAGMVAVEIKSRVPKQVRGALLDLIMHSFTKKLLFASARLHR
jgi:hypothetical protein